MKVLLSIVSCLFSIAVWEGTAQNTIEINNSIPIKDQFTRENCTYIIKEYVSLGGKKLIIPDNSIIIFKKKGTISEGTICFNNSVIKYSGRKARFIDCSFEGTLRNKELHISVMGVYADGRHDDAPLISQVFECIKDQGTHIYFNCNSDYLIGSEKSKSRPAVYVRSNTTVEFTGKGFLRLGCKSKIGAVLLLGGADNVTIINPLIDGGGKLVINKDHGEDGLALGGGGKNIRVYGGIIKNCAKGNDIITDDKYLIGDGGKGIQIEPYGLIDCVIDGTTIINCNKAISCYRDLRYTQPIQVTFNNIHAINCNQFAIVRQVYGSSSKVEEQDVTISNCKIDNCGNEDGVFIFGLTRFLRVENCKVVGSIRVPSIFRGRISKSVFNNIVINQPCESIINLDPSPYGPPKEESFQNYFSLKIKSPFDYFLVSNFNHRNINFNLYRSVINVNSAKKPVLSMFSGDGISPDKFTINNNRFDYYKNAKDSIYNEVDTDVKWDDKLGKLLLKEGNHWEDVEGIVIH